MNFKLYFTLCASKGGWARNARCEDNGSVLPSGTGPYGWDELLGFVFPAFAYF